ncbi:MAG: GNAT family N-acetyltransferase [Chloroflexi bacterium]|nr:GNAT family N-acetyltransferase [Chloroflexota bacterium]
MQNSPPPFHTERLILRDFKEADFPAFFATSNDPEYRQYYSEKEDSEEYWRFIFDRIRASAAAPERTVYQMAVCLKSGELIGSCGVRMEDLENRQASFGCAIARPYWGAGYAYEAARRLFDFGFSEMPIHRLYAETKAENRRARALAERLGMRLEGELRDSRWFKGRWWSMVIYAVLEGEWREKN